MLTADRLINLLHLEPLPVEGGYFRRTYLAGEQIDQTALPRRYRQPKAFGSAIYYLLHDSQVSALHRLATDEIYHFYLGEPVELLLLHPDGTHTVAVLGGDLVAGQHVQIVVPRGTWQGARLVAPGGWALLGTTMAPAYDHDDFELGNRETLVDWYPDCVDYITALTR